MDSTNMAPSDNANDSASGMPPPPTTAATENTSNTKNDRNQQRNKFKGNNKARQNAGRGGRGGKRTRPDRGDTKAESDEQSDWRDLKRRKVVKDADGNVPASYMNIQFSETEIAAEERRPKRKVAVMIGYAGTGYHGLQINHSHKTIEGELFAAFVAAGAIAKTNADDPRKSSFVRCARTDKGVHAGGNMVSLKLIIEDPDIVDKINEHLPPQIRIWGIERTNNNFDSHKSCDSRWYEYLIPSYCLLPPHPESYLGKQVLLSVKEHGLEDDYARRLGDAKDYWDEVEKNDIQPIMDKLDPGVQTAVKARLFASENPSAAATSKEKTVKTDVPEIPMKDTEEVENTSEEVKTEAGVIGSAETGEDKKSEAIPEAVEVGWEESKDQEAEESKENTTEPKPRILSPVDKAFKEIRAAYVAAKRRYRITGDRLDELQKALDHFVGTKDYHNYTVLKSYGNPSAKRNIKSFIVDRTPIQYEDTEWLSMKVHGQSFMMHQIRKMVGMASLVTRCATPFERFGESFGPARISIPKAPSLGLLLERPVFEAYNKKASFALGLNELDFSKYDDKIKSFKAEFIYRNIYELEEKENSFHTFYHQVDSFKSDYFLWVTASGLKVAHQRMGPREEALPKELEDQLDDEGTGADEGE